MIRSKRTLSFHLILILIIQIDLLCAQRVVRPVLNIGDSDYASNGDNFQYIPYQTGDDP